MLLLFVLTILNHTYRLTSTAIQFYNTGEKGKLLPSITICPLPAYKNPGTFYNNKIYLNNTFSLEEVLIPSSAKYFRNGTNFDIKETQSLLFGRCYTITRYFNFPVNLLIKFKLISETMLLEC